MNTKGRDGHEEPVHSAARRPSPQRDAIKPEDAMPAAARSMSAAAGRTGTPGNHPKLFATGTRRTSLSPHWKEMKGSDESKNYLAPSEARKSSTTAQVVLNDVQCGGPASPSSTAAEDRRQEIPPLKAMIGMDASPKCRSPATTTRRSSTSAAQQRGTPVHSRQEAAIAFRRPSQTTEEKPAVIASAEFNGLPSAQGRQEHNIVPAASSHGANGLPSGLRMSIASPTSRACLPGKPAAQQRASNGALLRKVSFPSRIAELIKVVPRSTFSLNGDEEHLSAHRGTQVGRGHRSLAVEDVDMLAEKRHFSGRTPERVDPFRRPTCYVADAGSVRPTSKQHALWMQDFSAPSTSDEAPKRRVLSFLDGDLSLALNRTACLCVTVLALGTAMFLVTFLRGHDELRQPSPFAPQNNERDRYDANHSKAFLQPTFEVEEWTTLTAADYGSVGAFSFYDEQSTVTDAQKESEVLTEGSEGGAQSTNSTNHPIQM